MTEPITNGRTSASTVVSELEALRLRRTGQLRAVAALTVGLGLVGLALGYVGPWVRVLLVCLGVLMLVVVMLTASMVRVNRAIDVATAARGQTGTTGEPLPLLASGTDRPEFVSRAMTIGLWMMMDLAGIAAWVMIWSFTDGVPSELFLILGMALLAALVMLVAWFMAVVLKGSRAMKKA
ncbi:MAG: hypothetical protein CVT66_10250 [Actinobacteria bacterium HGW-Actinobacteria-6]|nr:MAG: hypothetical protein CVT66_10250 [Actinobacteria bacterium HGW-Actinobacteria-6]